MVLTRSCYSILGTPLASSPNPDKINFSPGIRRSTRRRDSSQSTTIDHQSSSSSSPSINSYNSGKNHRIDSIKRQSSISAPNSPSPSSSSSSTNTNNTSQNLSQRLSSSTRLASETDLSSSCTTTQIQGSITEVSLDKPTPVTALGLVFRSKTADQSEIKTLSSPLTPVSVSPPFDYNYQSDLKESVPEQIETEAEEVQANHHKEEPPTQESGELKQTVGPQEHSDLEPVEHSGEAETVEGGDSKPDQDQPEKKEYYRAYWTRRNPKLKKFSKNSQNRIANIENQSQIKLKDHQLNLN
ncbi:hypothetical protein BY996DRAFT_110153 [Phakopsora pachyrhizi]|nr:hypothetical protein BY996DRAFT_110153 [Phakopsora pachyrhizi]